MKPIYKLVFALIAVIGIGVVFQHYYKKEKQREVLDFIPDKQFDYSFYQIKMGMNRDAYYAVAKKNEITVEGDQYDLLPVFTKKGLLTELVIYGPTRDRGDIRVIEHDFLQLRRRLELYNGISDYSREFRIPSAGTSLCPENWLQKGGQIECCIRDGNKGISVSATIRDNSYRTHEDYGY